MNTGGSLPDLTNLHFPPPLPVPLDPEETAYPSLSGGSSTSNLTHTMTHLGISGNLGLGYDAPGEWLAWPGVLGTAKPVSLKGDKGWEAQAPGIL